MKQPYGIALPVAPTQGDVCFLETGPSSGETHFCFADGVWTLISGAGGGTSRIEYGSACVLIGEQTNWNQASLPGAVRGTATDLQDNPGVYFGTCKWDLFEIESGGTIVNTWSGLDFANAADLYTFIRANFTPGVAPNTAANNACVRFYDVIDDAVPKVNKIWGINTFFSMLKGRRRYRDTTLGAIPPCGWTSFAPWFTDLCNQGIGFGPGHTYALGDEGALWTSRNEPKTHGLPRAGFVSTVQVVSNRRIWDWGASDFSVMPGPGDYANNPSFGALKIYCSLYLPTTTIWSWNSVLGNSLMQLLASGTYSTIALYALESTSNPNYRSLFLKPVGVDRLGLNWFDTSVYDLYALYTKKNSDPIIRPISLGSMSYPSRDLLWLDKPRWIPPHSGTAARLTSHMVGKGNYTTQFFLRDKVSKKVSPVSKARVVLAQRHRDAPFKYEVRV